MPYILTRGVTVSIWYFIISRGRMQPFLFLFGKEIIPSVRFFSSFFVKNKITPGGSYICEANILLTTGGDYYFSFRIPAQSNHMYYLFSYKRHLLHRFPSCGKRRMCVQEVPSVHKLLPDPSVSLQISWNE